VSVAAGTRKVSAPFVVDLSALLLKRNIGLSKVARVLYSTMRSLADGKTGALKIKDRWLKARAIDAAAEMCRCVRLPAMRELVALGLVTMERERIERVIAGRKRVVLGVCHYFVHRQAVAPANRKTKPFFLKSISSTVEEIDRQDLSQHPGSACRRGRGADSGLESVKRDRDHHHRPKADDDRPPTLPTSEKPNRIEVLQDRAIDFLVAQGEDRETVEFAIGMLDDRAASLGLAPPRSEKYYIACFESLKVNDEEWSLVASTVSARKARREQKMPGFDWKNHSDEPDPVLTEAVRVAIEGKAARAAT
jgi:hypothetical protein